MPKTVPFEGADRTFRQIAELCGVSDQSARRYVARGARTKREAVAMAKQAGQRMWWGARKGARVAPHVSLMPGEFRT